MKSKFKSCKTAMTSLTKHYLKVNLVLESKLNIGKASTMTWRGSMLIYKVSLKKKKLFGKASSNFWRNKRNRPRKTTKTL